MTFIAPPGLSAIGITSVQPNATSIILKDQLEANGSPGDSALTGAIDIRSLPIVGVMALADQNLFVSIQAGILIPPGLGSFVPLATFGAGVDGIPETPVTNPLNPLPANTLFLAQQRLPGPFVLVSFINLGAAKTTTFMAALVCRAF